MQFYNPAALMFLWALPLVAGLFWFSRKLWHRRLAQLGHPDTVRGKLLSHYRRSEWLIHAIAILLALFFAVMALARPQWGEEKKQVERKGIDLIFLLDTSLSMMAEDIKPNRLEKSKLEIKSFVRHLKGDRVGLVAFAGSSFLQTPLTLDYSAFFLFLDAIKSGYIPDPGTSLEHALARAAGSFPEEGLKHKAVVMFTDGEHHGGEITPVLKKIEEAGIRVYTIGLGNEQGEPIPLKDERGNRTGFKKDRAGQIVITKLNTPVLEEIAKYTGGLYLPSTPGEQEVGLIIRHMESLGQRKIQQRLVAEKEDHYQFFLLLAFLFLAGEMFVRRISKPSPQVLSLVLVFLMFSGFMETTGGLNKKGNALFEEKKFQTAAETYQKAKIRAPEDATIRYNLGTTLYQTRDYQDASTELEEAMKNTKDPAVLSRAYYNFGNTQYRLGNFEEAIKSYEKALEINPEDEDSKYNLEFLIKEKSLFDKKDEDRKQSQQQKDQQPQQQDKNQQSQKNQQQDKQKNEQNKSQQNDQQNQQEEPQEGDQEEEDKQEQPQDQDQEEKPDQGEDSEQKQPDQGDQQEEPQQPQQGDQEQPARPEEGQDQPDQAPQQGQEEGRGPLQGQMGMDNALRLLDALKEGEKELQDLRKPPANPNPPYVDKDW